MANLPISIAILASGRGSNAAAIIRHFSTVPEINVGLVVTNNPKAGVVDIAKKAGVPCEVITRSEIGSRLLETLKTYQIDFVVLAGFMVMVPGEVIAHYRDRMINIHPALLPKFGGKGMYGRHVHEAVSEVGESETGITIHFVNERYDEGRIIRQFRTDIEPHENPDVIAAKVQELEHRYYPEVIEEVVRQTFKEE